MTAGPIRRNPDVMPNDRAGGMFARQEEIARIWRVLQNVWVGNRRAILNRDGLRIAAAPGSGAILATVTSGSGTAHVCSLYAAGSESAATATGVAVTTPNVATGQALPVGTWLWVTQIGAAYYGLGTVWL